MADDGVGRLLEFLGGGVLRKSGVFYDLLGYNGSLLETFPNSRRQSPALATSVKEILHLFECSPGL